MAIPKISVFTDCGEESLVLRLPYEYACKLIFNSCDCEEKKEVVKWLKRQGSPKLKKYYENIYAIKQ